MAHHLFPDVPPAAVLPPGAAVPLGAAVAPGAAVVRAVLAVVLSVALAGPLAAPAPAQAQDRPLVLERIDLEGATRTARATVLAAFPLREGETATPDGILDAVDALRVSELFASVDFRTSRGSERGRFVLTLVVVEQGVELRLGTGYRDLDGWYLIPVQLRLDNRLGRGERLRFQAKLGYRVAGLELIAEDDVAGDGRDFWAARFDDMTLDQPYFVEGAEYRHRVWRGGGGASVGRRFGTASLSGGARFETVRADSSAEAFEDDDFRGLSAGDPLPFAELPPSVAGGVGETERAVLHARFVQDTRAARRVADTPVSGIWSSVRGEVLLREGADVGSVEIDFRTYRALGGGALALRVRGAGVGQAAAFYDRYHLGGLYTVRGYPSQSLSPPGGDTRFWTAALEYRAALAGRRDRPRALGFLFVDAGNGWENGAYDADDTAAAAGWGIRIRVPWIDSVGLDAGVPIGPSPVAQSFHVNLALGWNF